MKTIGVFLAALLFSLGSPAEEPCVSAAPEVSVGSLPQTALSVAAELEAKEVACPDALKTLKSNYLPTGVSDLCELHLRYQKAIKKLTRDGALSPSRTADLIAPRFIDLPDWNRFKAKSANADPRLVYPPAPQTWNSWEEAAAIVDQAASENFKAGKVQPITLEWLQKVHCEATHGLPYAACQLRTGEKFGTSFYRENTMPYSQTVALKTSEYKSVLHPGAPMIGWVPTLCHDVWPKNLDANDPNINWRLKAPVLKNPAEVFTDANGEQRQCGYILYPKLAEVKPQLELWKKEINRTVYSWGTPSASGDPVLVAARAQRWLVTVHPFEKGNGRTSRFVMEYLLQSLGLPTPILSEMNDDLGTSEKDWAREVGKGMLRSVQVLERCAADSTESGCNRVSVPLP